MSNPELEMKAREHDMSDANTEVIAEVTEAAAGGVVSGYKKIEKGVVSCYKAIETGVVKGYRKIEAGTVKGFRKFTDKCLQLLFSREGETVEETRKRLSRKVEE